MRSANTSSLTDGCSQASEVHFPGRRPAWGASLIAFETDEANADIEVVPATGGAPVNLTQNAADDRNPSWAPHDVVLP